MGWSLLGHLVSVPHGPSSSSRLGWAAVYRLRARVPGQRVEVLEAQAQNRDTINEVSFHWPKASHETSQKLQSHVAVWTLGRVKNGNHFGNQSTP